MDSHFVPEKIDHKPDEFVIIHGKEVSVTGTEVPTSHGVVADNTDGYARAMSFVDAVKLTLEHHHPDQNF